MNLQPKNDVPSATDPRGITSDPSTGILYLADGRDGGRQVLAYSLDMSSPNEATRSVNFEGAFSVSTQMDEIEGIAFHEPSGHLFLIDSRQKIIFEYTTTGDLVQQYDISGFSPAPESPQGLTFGPTSSTSDHPDELSLYIADAGDAGTADGGVYEAVIEGITPIDIRVMGDVPYNQAEYPELLEDLANVSPSDEFFVHLGDIKSQGLCVTSSYANFRNAMRTSPIPVFIVPGDNEYNDCPDPNQAWTYWDFYLMRLEEYWSQSFNVMRQSTREENFAFVHEGVLFIGINLVGGTMHDANEWSQRMTDNANWVNENFTNFGNQVTSALVFAHAFPNPAGGDRQQFGQDFVAMAQDFEKPILYMMGDQHGWVLDRPFAAAPNVTRVVVDQGVPSIRVTVSNHPTDPFSFSIPDVSPPTNQPPVLTAIGNRSVIERSVLSIHAWASDDSSQENLSYSLDSGAPQGASIDPETGQFSWAPGETSPGEHTVTLRVRDAGGLEDIETFTITVIDVNMPPVLAPIGSHAVAEGSLLTIAAAASDDDLPENSLVFSLDSGAPTGATINPSTGIFSWTPGEEHGPAVFSVTVRVTDNGVPALDDFETIEIEVQELNEAPELSTIGNKSVDEGSTLTFTAVVSDTDLPANNLTFTLDPGLPAGASFDPGTGQFSWTPAAGTSPGNYTTTLRVTDEGGLEDFETITITVNDVNLAPELVAIGARSVEEGGLLSFTASASDADLPANNLTYQLGSGAPDGATIDPTTGVFNWIPDESAGPGVHSITVRVNDDGSPSAGDFETISVTVAEVNQAPQLEAIGEKSVDEGNLLTFIAAATDADLPANELSFSLGGGAPPTASIDPQSGRFTWTPPAGTLPGNHTVTVRVTDDGGLEDLETITITVNDVNLPPDLEAIGAQSVEEGSLLTFRASATDPDDPENNLTFSLDTGAPAGATIDPNTGEFSWMPEEAAGPAVYTLTVRVVDDGLPSLDDFETITINVEEVNQAPILAGIDDKSIDEGSLLTFTATASDADSPANNLSFSLDVGAPAGATINPNTGEFHWRPTGGTSPGDHSITVRVSDDSVPRLDDFETITITVRDVNLPPTLEAIGAQSVAEESPLTFTAAATDADLPADNLSFSIDSGAPAGATIDPATGIFHWTPDESQGPGVYTFNVRVSDDGEPSLDDFETVTVTVDDKNLPPVLATIGAHNVAEGSLLTFTASATDADLPADNLAFSLDPGAPDGATIDPTTGVFGWTPDETQGPTFYSVTVRVTDDGVPSLEDFETFTITVGEVNQAPELVAIGDMSVQEGNLLSFTASATDVDSPANRLAFSLDAGAPEGAVIDPDTGEFRWSPPIGTVPGDHVVTIRVSDGGIPRLDDFETITITVDDVNLPPSLATIGAHSRRGRKPAHLHGIGD